MKPPGNDNLLATDAFQLARFAPCFLIKSIPVVFPGILNQLLNNDTFALHPEL